MSIIGRSGTDFFLTGGTALSRAYYNHRYSDDLDFFLNRSRTYNEQVDEALALLGEGGFAWDAHKNFIRTRDYATLTVWRGNADVPLKLDFVNDLVDHFGGIQETKLFRRTDSVRNILSNKLSAVYRYAPKDVADIWAIALHEPINWQEITYEAKRKDAGFDITSVCEIIKGIPEREFDSIAWTNKPDWPAFRADIDRIAADMLAGSS